MAALLSPPQFEETVDKWDAYKLRLEAFFEGNGVSDTKKKRAFLVAALSTRTVTVLSSLCAPSKVNDLQYEEVTQLLQEHYSPRTNEIAQSYLFFTRNQEPDETVKDFIVAIRQLADTCNFGSLLQRMLRDRIVCGIRDPDGRRHMLTKTSLTLAAVEEIALAAEMAKINVQQMTRQLKPGE